MGPSAAEVTHLLDQSAALPTSEPLRTPVCRLPPFEVMQRAWRKALLQCSSKLTCYHNVLGPGFFITVLPTVMVVLQEAGVLLCHPLSGPDAACTSRGCGDKPQCGLALMDS